MYCIHSDGFNCQCCLIKELLRQSTIQSIIEVPVPYSSLSYCDGLSGYLAAAGYFTDFRDRTRGGVLATLFAILS